MAGRAAGRERHPAHRRGLPAAPVAVGDGAVGAHRPGPVLAWASGPETAFEVALYQLLERVAPERVLAPIATDPGRGWMVLPDGGVTLGERLDELDPAEAMVVVLPEYGRLQRDLGPHVDELLRLGLADMRASVMPRRFEEAVEAVGRYVERRGDRGRPRDPPAGGGHAGAVRGVVRPAGGAAVGGQPRPQRPALLERVRGRIGAVLRLGGQRGRASLRQHAARAGMLRWQLEVGADDPAVVRPRDAYLEVFGDLASRAELVEELELACQVGKVGRAPSWHRALRMSGDEEVGEFMDGPLVALGSLLSGSWPYEAVAVRDRGGQGPPQSRAPSTRITVPKGSGKWAGAAPRGLGLESVQQAAAGLAGHLGLDVAAGAPVGLADLGRVVGDVAPEQDRVVAGGDQQALGAGRVPGRVEEGELAVQDPVAVEQLGHPEVLEGATQRSKASRSFSSPREPNSSQSARWTR